jgi:bacteriorhodopsin
MVIEFCSSFLRGSPWPNWGIFLLFGFGFTLIVIMYLWQLNFAIARRQLKPIGFLMNLPLPCISFVWMFNSRSKAFADGINLLFTIPAVAFVTILCFAAFSIIVETDKRSSVDAKRLSASILVSSGVISVLWICLEL